MAVKYVIIINDDGSGKMTMNNDDRSKQTQIKFSASRCHIEIDTYNQGGDVMLDCAGLTAKVVDMPTIDTLEDN